MVVVAFFLYPLTEWAFGHTYPNIPLFGVALCPTIIFSLALLCGAIPKIDKKVFILLLFPALVYGIGAPIIIGILADF